MSESPDLLGTCSGLVSTPGVSDTLGISGLCDRHKVDQEFSPRARKDSSFHSVPCSDGYSLIYWAEAEGQT